ncbi:mce related family protein [Mycobacterium kansasii 732]|nr:mce related family protein [Mycobacterium kansasii 732]
MIDRLTRIQLAIFGVITVITLVVMAVFYLRLPATFGLGTYGVSADFVAGGGLYKNANVTYRGVEVGRVESVELNPSGVTAEMRLNSGTPIPSNVTATVKSVSAIGEQYVDLVPPANPSPAKLRNGSKIERKNTRIGQDVADLLHKAEVLVNSLGDTRLRELLHEAFTATNGTGPELARLVESARLLVDEANTNYPQVSQLIDQAGPFLQAQVRAGADIKSLADGLARFTAELRAADPRLRDTLATAPDAIDEANTAFSGIRPSFPALAASLANLGRVGVIYHKSIEQLLVVLPALFAALTTAGRRGAPGRGRQAGLQDRPQRPAAMQRRLHSAAADPLARRRGTAGNPDGHVLQDRPERPQHGSRCPELPVPGVSRQAGTDDPVVPGSEGLRAAGPQPVARSAGAVRHTGNQRTERLAAQQVSLHSAGRRSGPGHADRRAATTGCGPRSRTGAAPAGAAGAAAQRQRPAAALHVVDAAGLPAAAAAAPVPEDAAAAAPPVGTGPEPQASGQAYTTYDQTTGVFKDPAGGTGIFAPGVNGASSAENWVDLMLAPKAM